MSKSNLNKWQQWYENRKSIKSYGDKTTYIMASDFFYDLKNLEDWGCGMGGFRKLCPSGIQYTGIDGSENKYADVQADLCKYKSNTEGILLRHVLEHNHDWQIILENAISSFTKKLCLIIFTPFSDKNKNLFNDPILDVPNISFHKEELIKYFKDFEWELMENIKTKTQFGTEYIFYINK